MANPVLKKLKEHNILLTRVPGNMTNVFQTLDLTVNGYFKLGNFWNVMQIGSQELLMMVKMIWKESPLTLC